MSGCHADPGVYLLLSENGIPYAFASNLDDPRLTVQRGDIADQSYLQSSKSDWTSPQNQTNLANMSSSDLTSLQEYWSNVPTKSKE